MQQGRETARFGESLVEEFDRPPLSVYFDHGDRQRLNNVAASKAFYGGTVHNINRLADVDIMIADKNTGNAIVIVEIEERDCSPKKIIGDVFAVALANKIAVGRKPKNNYTISSETRLIIVGVLPKDGARRVKVETVIQDRLRSFHRDEPGLNLQKVSLIFRDKLEDALAEVLKEIRKILTIPAAEQQCSVLEIVTTI
jgi:hypothetical protein